MPVPGPRNQFRAVSGYRNPEAEVPDMFNRWKRPGPVMMAGRTPGTMVLDLRCTVLAPGQIRRLYKQAINYVAAQPPYSWTENGPQPDQPVTNGVRGFEITRGWRYLISSRYQGAGDNLNYSKDHMHTYVSTRHVNPTPTVGAGNGGRNQPTIRNRLTSFGSRVPTLNVRVQAAQGGGN